MVSRVIADIRLDGGRLSLDFANSVHNHFAAVAEDYVATPERFVEWAKRAAGLAEPTMAPLSDADRVALMRDVQDLRAAIQNTLIAAVGNTSIPPHSLKTMNDWLCRARAKETLDSDGRFRRVDQEEVHEPLYLATLDLADLLNDDNQRLRLHRCANDQSCGWFFIDTSRGKGRRWCSMDTCGAADKMLRYRSKQSVGVDDRT